MNLAGAQRTGYSGGHDPFPSLHLAFQCFCHVHIIYLLIKYVEVDIIRELTSQFLSHDLLGTHTHTHTHPPLSWEHNTQTHAGSPSTVDGRYTHYTTKYKYKFLKILLCYACAGIDDLYLQSQTKEQDMHEASKTQGIHDMLIY